MKFLAPFLIVALSTTAFANLDTPLEVYMSMSGSRLHHRDETHHPQSGDPHAVYRMGWSAIPKFNTYHPEMIMEPFSAILHQNALDNLPYFVRQVLNANNIVNPQLNVLIQGINPDAWNNVYAKEAKHDSRMIFRPQYFFSPNTPVRAQGTVADPSVDWLAMQPDNSEDGFNFNLMPQDKRPGADRKLTRAGNMTFHGPVNTIGDVVASPPSGHIDLPGDRNTFNFLDFFTITRDADTGRSAVTLHWLLSQEKLLQFNELVKGSRTTRDIVDRLMEQNNAMGDRNSSAPGRAIAFLEGLFDYISDNNPGENPPPPVGSEHHHAAKPPADPDEYTPTVVVRTSPSAPQLGSLPSDWTWEGYLAANPGLRNLFDRKENKTKSQEEILRHHYLNWGQNSNLKY